MPIYEYACQKCGHVVEVFQKINDKGPGKCPKCGGKLARVLSNTSFQLKGGGWYKDLYSSVKPGGDSDSSEGPKPTPKSETKSETTASAPAEAAKPAAEAKPAKAEAKAKPAAKATAKAPRKSSKG